PFICHNATSLVALLRQSMSTLPSPLKSATPAIFQLASGRIAAPFDIMAVLVLIMAPFISQIASAPLALCRHRISAFPLPLKSPVPAMLHVASGAMTWPFSVRKLPDVMAEPFMLQSTSAPLTLRQRMSALLSPLKSLIPATFQAGSGPIGVPLKVTTRAPIDPPVMSQSARPPLVLRQKMSPASSPLKSYGTADGGFIAKPSASMISRSIGVNAPRLPTFSLSGSFGVRVLDGG